MKSLFIIWLLALGAFIGVYTYIYVSIAQLVISDAASPLQGLTTRQSSTNQTVNPQQTINGKELQGGL